MKKFLISVVAFFSLAAVSFAVAANFPDVSEDEWYYPGVKYVATNDIMTGYPDGNFGPNDAVNRAQLATVLYRLNASKIDNMLVELQAIRLSDTANLSGSSWDTYKAEYTRYPVEGVSAVGEGLVQYEPMKDNLVVKATDGNLEILSLNSDVGYFFIRKPSENEPNGYDVYGPFYDDVSSLISQI